MEPIKTSYYQANKQRVLKHMARKVHCESCDCEVSFCNLPRHNRSQKHLGLLKERLSEDEKQLLMHFDKYMKMQNNAQAQAVASE